MKNLIKERYENWRSFVEDEESININIFPVMFTVEESRSILIEDLPSSDRQINIINEEYILQFFGYLKKNKSEIKITIWYNLKLNDWDLPLSPLYHVDLLKRVIEWKKEKDGNIGEVRIEPSENSIYLSYSITPSTIELIYLFDVYKIDLLWCCKSISYALNRNSRGQHRHPECRRKGRNHVHVGVPIRFDTFSSLRYCVLP